MPEEYYSWQCEKLKAENYVLLLDDDDNELACMDTLRPDLPVFKEIEEICAKAPAWWLKVGLVTAVSLVINFA